MAASNIQVNLSNGTTNVDILIEGQKGIEHNFDKQLIIISQPNKGSVGTLTLLNDIQRLKEVIVVNGWLEDTDSESGLTKKQKLTNNSGTGILQTAKKCTLSWGSGATAQTYDGDIIKGIIKEKSGKLGDEGSQGKIFTIMLQFAVGTFRG